MTCAIDTTLKACYMLSAFAKLMTHVQDTILAEVRCACATVRTTRLPFYGFRSTGSRMICLVSKEAANWTCKCQCKMLSYLKPRTCLISLSSIITNVLKMYVVATNHDQETILKAKTKFNHNSWRDQANLKCHVWCLLCSLCKAMDIRLRRVGNKFSSTMISHPENLYVVVSNPVQIGAMVMNSSKLVNFGSVGYVWVSYGTRNSSYKPSILQSHVAANNCMGKGRHFWSFQTCCRRLVLKECVELKSVCWCNCLAERPVAQVYRL